MSDSSPHVATNPDATTKQNPLAVQQPSGDVEMENLSTIPPKPVDGEPTAVTGEAEAATSASAPATTSATTHDGAADDAAVSTVPAKAPVIAHDPDLAINPVDPADPTTAGDLAVEIMLVLVSNGNRHPFRIDEKYLTKRSVTITGISEDGRPDPSSITVYTLKELILREWRPDWDQPPREPSAIRLVFFGKLLEDRMPLNRKLAILRNRRQLHLVLTCPSEQRFKMSTANVVHMTVKPQDIIDEEEATKRVKDTTTENRARGGCCVIL